MAVVISGSSGGGPTLSDYYKTWVLDFGGSGDFATVEEIEASSAVVDGDTVWVFGQSFAGATTFSKALTWYLAQDAILTLPTTMSSTGINTFSGYGLVYASADMTCAGSIYTYGTRFGIQNMTISGTFYAHNTQILNGSVSFARTMTVATIDLYNCHCSPGSLGGLSKFLVTGTSPSEIYNSHIPTFEHSGTGTLYMDNFSSTSTVTKSNTGTVYLRNGRVNSLTFSTNGVNITLSDVSVTGTLTLPATVGTTSFRNVKATTLTAPGSVEIDSVLGIYGSVTNVTFSSANVNVVAGSFA